MSVNDPTGQPTPLRPGEFQSQSVPTRITFGITNIQPPSPLYVQRDDSIFIGAITGNAPETITLQARLLLPEGVIIPINRSFILNSAYTLPNFSIPLTEGFLLSVTVIASQATTRGATFARAFVVRGGQVAQNASIPLFADYITTSIVTGWPGGRIINPIEGPGMMQHYTVANPPAGTNFVFGPQPATRFRVISLQATLTTTAAVANRLVQMLLTLVAFGVDVWRGAGNQAIPASTTAFVAAQSGGPTSTLVTTFVNVTLPDNLIMRSGDAPALESAVANIQAGDQWSNINVYGEEWFDL